jgi:adenosylcobinamide kinase/adenosylcobinamide-phosphate guanylyltransferase
LELAAPYPRRTYVATAQAVDAEMAERIRRHREERGLAFETLEAPVDLEGALASLAPGDGVAVVDCLTLWLGNLVHRRPEEAPPVVPESYPEVEAFLRSLERPPFDLVVVTNELGMGIVPATVIGRAFRDLAGRVNQEVARRAARVVLMVSGLPLEVKGSGP